MRKLAVHITVLLKHLQGSNPGSESPGPCCACTSPHRPRSVVPVAAVTQLQTWRLQTAHGYSFPVLEVRSLKWVPLS